MLYYFIFPHSYRQMPGVIIIRAVAAAVPVPVSVPVPVPVDA